MGSVQHAHNSQRMSVSSMVPVSFQPCVPASRLSCYSLYCSWLNQHCSLSAEQVSGSGALLSPALGRTPTGCFDMNPSNAHICCTTIPKSLSKLHCMHLPCVRPSCTSSSDWPKHRNGSKGPSVPPSKSADRSFFPIPDMFPGKDRKQLPHREGYLPLTRSQTPPGTSRRGEYRDSSAPVSI
jgi:hypothetical protein